VVDVTTGDLQCANGLQRIWIGIHGFPRPETLPAESETEIQTTVPCMRAGERKSYYMSVRNNVPEEFRATPDTPGITAVPYSFFSSTTSLIFFFFSCFNGAGRPLDTSTDLDGDKRR
jgi:hypothetical protein